MADAAGAAPEVTAAAAGTASSENATPSTAPVYREERTYGDRGQRRDARPTGRAREGARPDRGRGAGAGGHSVRRAGRTTAERPRARRESAPTTRPRVEAPPLPDEAQPEMLDHEIRRDLRGLPLGLAEVVSRHLVAAAMFLDDDPHLALAHARTAASLAARLPATREAAGIAAYHAGEYATALVELRTARRMDGSPRYLPMIADAERGLGRPERAVVYLTDPAAEQLDPAGRAELLIVGSGARRDLDQPEAAIVLLEEEATRPGEPKPWTARLRYAYAEALLAAGRTADAIAAFESAVAVDEQGETDAGERAFELMTAQPAKAEQAPAVAVTSAPEVGKGRAPVLFDDGGVASEATATETETAAEEETTARAGATLPDLTVLFSDLGLREIPADQRAVLVEDDLDDEDLDVEDLGIDDADEDDDLEIDDVDLEVVDVDEDDDADDGDADVVAVVDAVPGSDSGVAGAEDTSRD